MPHSTPLISTIVAGLVLAFIFGAIANRFRLPPLVGYLIAGVLVGPNTPGFVGDIDLAIELSEIGVILLMFGVGLHFSLKDLLSVRALAIPGALVQIGGATVLGLGLALVLGWSVGAGLIFGLALSVASTVVLLKALQDRHMVESEKGKIAVGWLIVEDIAMVLALVLIPAIASINGVEAATLHDPFIDFVERFTGPLGLLGILVVTIVKLAAFVGFMLVVGRRVIPFVLHYTAHTGSRELFRLAVLAIALGVAAGAAYLFGVSLALGAFFAGMILSESELSHRAANESLPLRDAFAVLFFVSVGMLFDPSILLTNPLPVIATVLIIVVGKSIFSFLIVLAFRQPISTALTISASLAQIGEFSFILAALGVGLGILPPEGRDLILAGAIISIILNPLIFMALDALRPRLEQKFGRDVPEPAIAAGRTEPGFAPAAAPAAAESVPEEEPEHATAKTGHVVLVGYGRVGSVVADALAERQASFVVIEDAEGRVKAARGRGFEVIVGNAAGSRVLNLANVDMAATVIVAIPNAFEAGQAVEQARKSNPKALIVARAHSDEEEEHLKTLGADVVILGEREIAMGMVDVVNRDSSAIAEITAADAVASALGPLAGVTPEPKLSADPNLLAEAIEAAHIQHPDTGPAEPPYLVSSLGEEPDREPDEEQPVSELVEMTSEQRLAPLVPSGPRPALPATKAGDPFNPEVPPPVEEKA
jgi:CPA2 family monovalent cation:H+ antiporter-2